MVNHSLKYVIGIGASAGGLEAIQEFFNHMPKTDQLTFVIVQHLSPDFKSMMKELLVQSTSMPIVIVKNKMPLKAGVIYLIPANFEAQIENNHFELSKLNRKSLPHPISTLFESLAIAYTKFSLGIIFSGTGSDGVLGMKEIARRGGLTIVQTPSEAKFRDMPNNAIATKEIHYILSASEMPDMIIEYINQPAAFNKNLKQMEPINQMEYDEIFHLLDKQYKINFGSYKIGTISRRTQRRMQLLGIENLQTYIQYIKTDDDGLKTLYQDLLIGVTEFFRNPEAFAVLESEVIPALFKKINKTQELIRIWINPCATGEEAYSIAILFKKYAEEHNLPFAVQIFASDVFNGFLQEAKKGCYSYNSVAHIPSDILNKYFIKSGAYYEVIPEIKHKILFTKHNLLNEHPFTKMDLISCRNLLIYINPKEQKRITDLLRFSLNIGGFLFLGPSEGLSSLEPDLIANNQLWRIFKKTKRSNLPQVFTTLRAQSSTKELQLSPISTPLLGSLPLYAYNAILQDVVSAGFIIDSSFVVLHSIGKAREMVALPEGAPTLILPKIIIDDLKAPLITALHEAKNKLIAIEYDHIPIHQSPDKVRIVKMAVHPICDTNNKVTYYWICLDPVKATIKKQNKIVISGTQKDSHLDEIIITLERELSESRVLLQSSLENMETINEEMQSTNEELQSVNEELYTVNIERSKKIEEVIQTKADIDNLIRGAEICTIILNNKFEIRVFTPSINKIFNLVSHDIGRPLKNFRHNLKFGLMMAKVEEVLKNNTPYAIEVKNHQNYWYYLKIMPYYSSEEHIVTGVVITLTDINEIKQLHQQKEGVEKDLRAVLKTGLMGVWRINLENDGFSYDETIKNIFGLNSLSCINQLSDFIAAIHPNDRKRIEKIFAETIKQKGSFEQVFRIVRPNKSIRHISCSANIHQDPLTNQSYITGICMDNTAQYWLDEKVIDAEHLNLGLDDITDGWWDWNLIENTTYLSPLLKKTLGYDDHEIANRMESYEQFMFPDDLKLLHSKMDKYVASNSTEPMVQKIRIKHKNGSLLWILSRRKGIRNNLGKLIRVVGTITDITEMKETETTLELLAYRDLLTQIPNRVAFLDALVRAIERAKRNKSIFAVMFLDIDDFKKINDKLGHNIGDAALCAFTKKIINYSRSIDFFARLGGDEFGILLEDIVDQDEIPAIAGRYLSAFSEPLVINESEIFITISIGVAFYPEHGKTDQEILKHADNNMYLAKNRGKNQFVL